MESLQRRSVEKETGRENLHLHLLLLRQPEDDWGTRVILAGALEIQERVSHHVEPDLGQQLHEELIL